MKVFNNGGTTMPTHKEREPFSVLLQRICSYSNCVSQCPISLVQEVLTFFPERLGLHLSDGHVRGGYNGLAGIGGQGIVICAHNTYERKVALKIVRPAIQRSFMQFSDRPNDFAHGAVIPDCRFLESAGLQNSLEEESSKMTRSFVIPRVYDMGEKPVPFMVMSWIEGMEALCVIKDRNDLLFSLEEFTKVLDCASFLHSYNIVYRDFKHANIMITHDFKVALIDFGLAKEVETRNVTLSGTPLGTPPYASLRLMRNAELANHIDDIHALGYTFWEFVTHRECPNYIGSTTKIDDREKYRIDITRFLPDSCKRIFFDATTMDEQRVYRTCDEFKEAVQQILKSAKFRSGSEDYINTQINPQKPIQNIEIPLKPMATPKKLEPPSNEKKKDKVANFSPASFSEYNTQAEAKFLLEQIEKKKKNIMDFDCLGTCQFPLCQGRGICKKILCAQIDILKDIFF